MSEPETWRDEVEITHTPCDECKGWSREWRLVGNWELVKYQRNHRRTCSTNAMFREQVVADLAGISVEELRDVGGVET